MNKPVKPNITIPAEFATNGVKTDFDNSKLTDGFDRLNPDVLAGDNLNKLIDDTYKASNYALDLGDYVLGHNQITNCILEAPNGVATYSGLTITVKEGLKLLLPNGRNADGTLKNTEYTIQSDITLSGIPFGDKHAISINKDGVIGIPLSKNVLYSNEIPLTRPSDLTCIYSEKENKWYFGTPSEDFAPIELTLIGYLVGNGTTITELKTYNPINILKQSDKSQISGWGMPSNKYIDLTLGASGTEYTAPDNGYVYVAKVAGGNAYITLTNLSNELSLFSRSTVNTDTITSFIPVSKGDRFRCSYSAVGTTKYFRFIYTEGEV